MKIIESILDSPFVYLKYKNKLYDTCSDVEDFMKAKGLTDKKFQVSSKEIKDYDMKFTCEGEDLYWNNFLVYSFSGIMMHFCKKVLRKIFIFIPKNIYIKILED